MGKLKKIGIGFGIFVMAIFILVAISMIDPNSIVTSQTDPMKEILDSVVTSQSEPTAEQYVMTDKKEYGLGDIIKVNGRFTVPPPTYGLDGNVIDDEHRIKIELKIKDSFLTFVDRIYCAHVFEDREKFQAGEYSSYDGGQEYKCNIDDEGNFKVEFEVMNEYAAGEYEIRAYLSKSKPDYTSNTIGRAFVNIG